MTEIAERTARGFTRSQAGALLAVLLVALGVRACMVARTEAIAQDGVRYLYMAREFGRVGLAGSVERYQYHPGYSAVVALAAWATGAEFPHGWIRAAQWVSVFMSMVTLSGLYVIARVAFGHRIGLLTVLLLGLSGPYARISCDVLSDPTAAAMVVLSAALGLGAVKALRSGSGWTLLWAGGAGLAVGAGYLTRPEAILGGPVVAVLLLSVRGLSARGRAMQLGALAILAVAALACVVPYAAAIGGFTQKKGLSDLALSGGSGPLLAAAAGGGGAHTYLEAVWRGVDRLRASLGTPIAALALITWLTWAARGIFHFRLSDASVIRPTRDGIIVMFLPAAVMVPLVISMEIAQGGRYISSRHMLLACLFLAPCTGAGVITLAEWTLALVGAMRLRQIPWVSVWGWSAGIAVALMFQAFPILHRGKGCFRQAGTAIRERFAGQPVLTDDPRVALFAGAPGDQFFTDPAMPWLAASGDLASVERLTARAQHSRDGRRYAAIALSGQAGARIAPKLPPDKFAPIGQFPGGGGEKVWAFQRR